MQNAIRTMQIPLFGTLDQGAVSLNAHAPKILSLSPTRSAPAPLGHNHVRPQIHTLSPSNCVDLLLQADIATILPRRARSARALWHMMARMAAGALDAFDLHVTPTPSGTDVIAAPGEGDVEEDTFHARLPRNETTGTGLVEGMLAFVNEILETHDTFGRLYVISVEAEEQAIAYLTEGEVDALEAAGICADLI